MHREQKGLPEHFSRNTGNGLIYSGGSLPENPRGSASPYFYLLMRTVARGRDWPPHWPRPWIILPARFYAKRARQVLRSRGFAWLPMPAIRGTIPTAAQRANCGEGSPQ